MTKGGRILVFIFWILEVAASGVVAATATTDMPKTGAEAFERYLAMAGGRPALETVRSVLVQGTRVQGHFKSPFELKARRTGEFIIRTVTPDGGVRRIGCDARGLGWIEENGVYRVLTEAMREERRLMMITFLPLAHFRGKDLLGSKACQMVKEGGRRLVLVGEGAGKVMPRMLFEPGTWRLRRLGKFTFKDYRFSEGVFVPYWLRDGAVVYHVQTVRFVQPMGDTEFAAPKDAELLPALRTK